MLDCRILSHPCTKSLQSCLTLCNAMDCSLPGSSVHRILQKRIPEWVAKPSSRELSQPRDRTCVSYVSCICRQVVYLGSQWGSQIVKSVLCLITQSCLTLCEPMDCSLPGSSVHGDSLGENTRVGCHALLQGIFPIQGLNPGLPHCRRILYHLNHQESLCKVYFQIKMPPTLVQKQNRLFWENHQLASNKCLHGWIHLCVYVSPLRINGHCLSESLV